MMNYCFKEENGGCIAVSGISPYSLSDTLECGQCFRFDRVTPSSYISEYTGVAMGRYVHVAQPDEDTILFFGTGPEDFKNIWLKYFSLDVSLSDIKTDILRGVPAGNKLYTAAEAAKGIAILKQDAWETLFSFIVSQNNNIPRIRKIIRTVCESYGKKTSGGEAYAFPTPQEILSDTSKLDAAHVGFRLRYLIDAAEKVSNGTVNLEDIARAGDYETAKKQLIQIVGVGSKVADCVLLYGMNYLEAFPIDVWIKRVMGEYFTDGFTYKSLGKYAGIAQQYMFYYARTTEKK